LKKGRKEFNAMIIIHKYCNNIIIIDYQKIMQYSKLKTMSPNILFLFMTVVVASVVANEFSLIKIPSSTPVGGKCLDGTQAGFYLINTGWWQMFGWHQAGFYIRHGKDPSHFIIHLEGGGYCSSLRRDCYLRTRSGLGSSTFWNDKPDDESLKKNALLINKCSQNPVFCEATTIYVPYCMGDVHIGTHTTASEDTWGYHFDGQSITTS
jgi:hypothetical protein